MCNYTWQLEEWADYLYEGVVTRTSHATLGQVVEEPVRGCLINAEGAEKMPHLALRDATIIITVNDAKCFAHMRESLRCLFTHLLQHVVEFIGDLGNHQPCGSSIQH